MSLRHYLHIILPTPLAVFLLFCSGMTWAMQPMADQDLAAVTGQQGVALELQFRINTDASGNPLSTLTNCGGGSGPFTNSECRFALHFNNRNDCSGAALGTGTCTAGSAGSGEWLLFRGVYGFFNIQDINLNAGVLSQPGDPAGYFDVTKFEDDTGTCLVAGGCTDANIKSSPALAFNYPTPSPSYNPSTGVSTGYSSLEVGIGIKEALIAYGQTAYNDTTTTGSFLGVDVADNNGGPAGVAVSGTAYVYGF